jgi:hypothetical protein
VRCGTFLSSSGSCATRHAAVDHEFRPRHVAGRVRGEEQHAVYDVLHRSDPTERHPALAASFD